MIDCKASKIAKGEGETWSIYDVKKHAYDNEEEPTPHWVDMDKRPSRYGPWIHGDFIRLHRLFYLEEEFMNRTHSVEQLLARDTELDPFEDHLVLKTLG
jgi:hypothetical protein